ncbi:hypothetical protein [Sphingomonas sp. Leaf412]|uniref:hypothetical protein n=1 Tax=Sphingomonas sp. Leaf412 TaxID=1736370 RepID=UPI000B277D08|nr:hypothetical protein [Sphingomonas sp. Leaf412]
MADEAKHGDDDTAATAMEERATEEKQPGNILAGVQPENAPDREDKTERRED